MKLGLEEVKTLKRVLVAASCLILFGCSSVPKVEKKYISDSATVRFGGIALIGNASEVQNNFPVMAPLMDNAQLELNSFYFKYFTGNRDRFEHIDLLDGLAEDNDRYVLVFALSNERITTEKIDQIYKSVVHLSGSLMIVDFREKMIVSAYPQAWEISHVTKELPSTTDFEELLAGGELGLKSDFFLGELENFFPMVSIISANAGTLQVKNVGMTPPVWESISPQFDGNTSSFKQWFAENISTEISSELGVPVMPFQKDARLAKISMRFADGSVQNFRIPEGTYGIDAEVAEVKKITAAQTAIEQLFVYGAYADVRLYEPERNITFYQGRVKAGVKKKVPLSQLETDDAAMFQDALKSVSQGIPQSLWEDKNARKEIQKCIR